MSNDYVMGSVVCCPADAPAVIDAMAESIVELLLERNQLIAERDFYKAAAGALMKPAKGRRKQ
jgi:hypothetical protein